MELNSRYFPEGFKFGAATAAYQVEGGWNEDGKGEQLWDWYTHTYPDQIVGGANGDVACDSYHKWEEDIELLKELGVNHYRMSLSWSRILPYGTVNYVNEAGVQYYKNIFEVTVTYLISQFNMLPLIASGGLFYQLRRFHFGLLDIICQ